MSAQIEIKPGSRWVYTGPSGTQNMVHLVTSVEPHEITTWSRPSLKPDEGGEAWLGDVNDFRRYFRPVV